jgi:hypothetical protein
MVAAMPVAPLYNSGALLGFERRWVDDNPAAHAYARSLWLQVIWRCGRQQAVRLKMCYCIYGKYGSCTAFATILILPCIYVSRMAFLERLLTR